MPQPQPAHSWEGSLLEGRWSDDADLVVDMFDDQEPLCERIHIGDGDGDTDAESVASLVSFAPAPERRARRKKKCAREQRVRGRQLSFRSRW